LSVQKQQIPGAMRLRFGMAILNKYQTARSILPDIDIADCGAYK